ncbi:MAG: ATP-binding protein [Leptospiraceae bacterium]|nr:hypothetical protein [Leptospiraceae bacterium]MCK6381160.1 ATP-binding protein [Leptospiraceae bacterium]
MFIFFLIVFSNQIYPDNDIIISPQLKKILIVEQKEIFNLKKEYKLADIADLIKKNQFQSEAGKNIDPGLASGDAWILIKLKIENVSQVEKSTLLFKNPFIDEAELYFLETSPDLSFRFAGSYTRGKNQKRNLQDWFISPGISFSIYPEKEVTLLLHFKSKTMLKPAFKIGFKDEIEMAEIKNIAFIAFYFGSIFALFLYNIFIYASIKDFNYFWYILYLFFFILFQAQYSGITANLFSDPWIYHILQSATAGLSIAGTTLFVIFFLQVWKVNKLLYYLLGINFLLGMLVFLVSPFKLLHIISLKGIAVIVLCFLVTSFISAILALSKGFRSAKFYIISSALNLLFLGMEVSYTFLGQPYSFVSENALKFGSLSEAILLSFALADKINFLRQENLAVKEEHSREKKILMRNLHDTVGSSLTQLLYNARNKAFTNEAEMEETIYSTLSKLRDFVYLLNRDENFSEVLIKEMENFLSRLKSIGKYEVLSDLKFDSKLLNSKNSFHLYNIFCECVTNIIKHASAKKIHIKLSYSTYGLFFTISDDGIGMQPSSSQLSRGSGLSNIKYRVSEMSGRWKIYSKQGTVISILIPIRAV